LPILTYHKLGPRPVGARLKGLYVSRKLFSQQLAELKAAGWVSTDLAGVRPSPGAAGPERSEGNSSTSRQLEPAAPGDGRTLAIGPKRFVITFDDGFRSVIEHALDPLREHQFRAIQFIVADRIGRRNEWDLSSGEICKPLMDAAEIRAWLDAGHQIGSHSLTHAFLTRMPLEQAREEISSSKKQLEDRFGIRVKDFCYPYGDWNPAVRDLVVDAGYETACTTQFGVNTLAESPWALKRVTARYRSRTWRNFKQWCAGWVGRP